MPPELGEADAALDWIGPTVEPDELPHFEIEYTPGGETVYHRAVQGSEGAIRPGHLPALASGDLAYVVPLIDPELQLAVARHLRDRGVRVACGTNRGGIQKQRGAVERVLETSEMFFCNEGEAELLFGDVDTAAVAPGRILAVTRGEAGARIVLGSHAVDVDPVPADELDPTGAGDTFCGTMLARIGAGEHPVMAARRAAAAAADMIAGVGPERLLAPGAAPLPPADPRVRVDGERVDAVAGVIAIAPEATPFDFTGPSYPKPGDPRALDFFFAATLQQFGFWTARDGSYEAPMIARLGGEALKGSDFLWAAYRRWLDEAPEELSPAGQAALDQATFDRRLRDHSGGNPLPAKELHRVMAVAYGRDMAALGRTPEEFVAGAGGRDRPLAAFLAALDRIGGYKEDPWRKKPALLAAILNQRPERFLRFGENEDLPPIVDYHCMRSCLRLGLVDIVDPDLHARLSERRLLADRDEEAVRAACAEAVALTQRASGRSMGAVDWFFFQMRRRCPEMSEPDCPACPADPACAHRKGLFQPVLRTAAY